MIKNVRIKAKMGKAVKIYCRFNGNVQDYALAWLHLTNNAREYPKIFLKHYNNSGNGVTVITPEKHVEQMKEYLEGLSHDEFEVNIMDEEIVSTVTPVIDWGDNWMNDDVLDELDSAEVLSYEDD